MALDVELLQKHLCVNLGECVQVAVSKWDGSIMLDMPFEVNDGDLFPMQLMEAEDGKIRISDRAFTYNRISTYDDVDELVEGRRGALLQSVVRESGVVWDNGEIYMDTEPENLARAAFVFGRALTRIWDLVYLSREVIGGDVNLLPRWWDGSSVAPIEHCRARAEKKFFTAIPEVAFAVPAD